MTIVSSLVSARVAAAARVSSQRGALSSTVTSIHQHSKRWMSDASPKKDDEEFDFVDDLPNKQDFVKVKLEPGEWDVNHTDPLHRPPWKNKASIMSSEDFANAPRAGFDNEYASPHDAMLVLSWLDRATQDKIYQSYLNLMTKMSETEKTTSHEYVVRVVAQKYNITASRVAGVIQLLHNEDQIREEHPDQKIYYDTQDYVDARIAEHIANCYDAFKEPAPEAPFIEDPMGVSGMGDIDRRRAGVKEAGDELDYDDLVEKALIREQREARLWIDNHIYVEDVDEDSVKVKTTADCNKLLKAQQAMKKKSQAGRTDAISPKPESGEAEVRPRWKYVAETINTRDLPKKKYRRPRKGKVIKNAIVEQDGELRPASVSEVKHTSWKPERDELEFTYQGVKQAWLERKLQGNTAGWGRVERPKEVAPEPDATPALEDEVVSGVDLEDGDVIAAGDAETEVVEDESEGEEAKDEEAPPTAAEDKAPASEIKGEESDDAK